MKNNKKKIINAIVTIVLVVGLTQSFLASSIYEFSNMSLGSSSAILLGNYDTLGVSHEAEQTPMEEESLPLGVSDSELELDESLNPPPETVPLGESGVELISPLLASEIRRYDSIAGVIEEKDRAKIAIIPGTDGTAYQTFDNNYAGLQNAVYTLYQSGKQEDYVLYVGTSFSVPANATLTQKVIPGTPSSSNITFYALQGKIGTLTIVGSHTDPTSSSNLAPTDAITLGLGNAVHMGTNVVLRNIKYNSPLMFMEGHSLTLDHGSNGLVTTSIYGGSASGDIVGNPRITVYSTGSNPYSIYGGNKDGGSLTGNTEITVHNTTWGINTISGGGTSGDIYGNTKIVIHSVHGDISNIYGGGVGSPERKANVDGSVHTELHHLTGNLAVYYGGVLYGDITGSVTNIIDGVGGFTASASFFGGSREGNIGSQPIGEGATPSYNAITTVLDSSNYTQGAISFVGGNTVSGTISGHIQNTISAGSYNKGSLRYLYGGGDVATTNNFSVSTAELEARPLAERASYFASKAKFRVYGNITTEVKRGSIGLEDEYGWARGAGYGGYIQGDVTLELGTEDLVYSTYRNQNLDLTLSTRNKTRGMNTNFDIVAGGGNIVGGTANIIYIKGDTRLIQRFVLARWTYGGNFNGILEGNSSNELHKGFVDTLEGAGYIGQRVYGNSHAALYGGQVDWFVVGGGWSDTIIDGNISSEVHGGLINASVGGTYGANAGHTVTGNSSVLITGGNFSGSPRGASNGFSPGVTNVGTINGNSSLTLDFRDAKEPFVPPIDTQISGGKPTSAGTASKLGTTEENTITVNIFTNPGDTSLENLTVFGDSGAATSTKSGSIVFHIDAPGASMGHLYASDYSNLTTGKILRNVYFDIEAVGKVETISGGNKRDSFTNIVTQGEPREVKISFNESGRKEYSAQKIEITTGVYNFTDVIINDATINLISGKMFNGTKATTSSHGSSHNKFGNIHLKNQAHLQVGSNSIMQVSGNVLILSGKVFLQSPSGENRLVFSDIQFNGDAKLEWERVGGTALVGRNGTWFGNQQSYDVLTFNPNAENAKKITPFNFSGTEGEMPLLGDNAQDTNGYAVAIPSTVVNFKVAEGLGTIHHNMNTLKDTLPLQGISSVNPNTPAQEGWLILPNRVTGAELTFTPDSPSYSWLKKAVIHHSAGTVTEIPEQVIGDTAPIQWKVPAKRDRHDVEVFFTNMPELQGHSAIVSEAEAQLITSSEQVNNYLEIQGRPFLEAQIDEALLKEIRKPLAEDMDIRYHAISYSVGTGDTALQKTFQLAVVKNSAVIEKNSRGYAIDAQNAVMMFNMAKTITAEQLNANYTFPTVYQADSPIRLDANSVVTQVQEKLNTVTTPTTVFIEYTWGSGNSLVKKQVSIGIIPDGQLQFKHLPKLDFGVVSIPTSNVQLYVPEEISLSVEDSRVNPFGSDWTVQATASDLVSGDKVIPAYKLKYSNTNSSTGPTGVFPLNSPVVIWNSSTNNEDYQVLPMIKETNGFFLDVNPSDILIGEYSGTVTWTLSLVP